MVSVERVYKRHTPGRRAIAHQLDAEQAGQRADMAVSGQHRLHLQTFKLGIIICLI